MLELDFSKLEGIAYRGIDKEEAEQMPIAAPPANEADTSPAQDISPSERRKRPFTGMGGKRNYRAMYRAACDFHEQHNPPLVNVEYWKAHQPGSADPPPEELEYWRRTWEAAAAIGKRAGNDPFIIGMLVAIFDELGREYDAIRAAAYGQNSRKE